eukprot:2494406-Prymnesium_polylepis.1
MKHDPCWIVYSYRLQLCIPRTAVRCQHTPCGSVFAIESECGLICFGMRVTILPVYSGKSPVAGAHPKL